MRLFLIMLLMILSLGFVKEAFPESTKEKQVCQIQTRILGRFFNRCPIGALIDEVDVRVSGQPPYSYFTTVMVSCVKQVVVCSK